MSMRVVKMVRRIPKRVDLEFCQEVLRQLLQKPVEDQSTFDTALRVQDENHLRILGVIQFLLDDFIGCTDVACGISEITLD